MMKFPWQNTSASAAATLGGVHKHVIIAAACVAALVLFAGIGAYSYYLMNKSDDNITFVPQTEDEPTEETDEGGETETPATPTEEPTDTPATGETPASGGSSGSSGGSSGSSGGSSGGGSSGGGSSGGGSSTPSCSAGTHVPGGSDGAGGCWPGANNTGVPAGTTLTTHGGSCTITTPNTTINAKTMNCTVRIQASNVTITNSRINGIISVESGNLIITDSSIVIGNQPGTGLGEINFVATRINVSGGNRSINCFNSCTVRDSYVHSQFEDSSGVYHESGIRMGQSTVLRHNTISCTAPNIAPDAGCSADLTGYGDFGPVQNNTIDNNLFVATQGAFCAYGGSSAGKPYSAQTNHIVFTNNIFQRGTMPDDHGNFTCALYGPISDYDSGAPGNVWSNNKWNDGTALNV